MCLLAALELPSWGQTLLDDAYSALRSNDLDKAAELFQRGLVEKPDHLIARKDYAYVLLKLGETEAARDQFGETARRDPGDHLANLEYGFLCHETGRRREAYLVFERVMRSAVGSQRKTAEDAYQSIDKFLAAGIAQWTEAARQNPNSDSVHEELARLLEDKGDFAEAEKHYAEAWQLKPTKRTFLLDLGRVRQAQGRSAEASAAFLAALRSHDIRLSEHARELLGTREQPPEIVAASLALEPKKTVSAKRGSEVSAIEMGDRSFQLGYLSDALRYYTEANEADPTNAKVQLQLGWVNHLLHQNSVAYRWFETAGKGGDPSITAEARRARRNLRASEARVRPTIWIAPMYSSRWSAGFLYGQAKLEFRSRWGVQPYLSLRFNADTGAVYAPAPLSERAITPAVGLATKSWHGINAWIEGGGNFGGIQGADARGGLFHAISRGQQLGQESKGFFWQGTDSLNYASRFSHDVILGTQQRVGYTIGRLQPGWLLGAATDSLRQYWANYVETGPSVRAQIPWLSSVTVTFDAVRGRNYVERGNPLPSNYWDFRVSLWYAFTY